jgi:hypothetical protein
MTLAGVFFSNRARTSAHIALVALTGVSGDFSKDLERAGCKSETVIPAHQNAGYTHQVQRQYVVFKRLKICLVRVSLLAKGISSGAAKSARNGQCHTLTTTNAQGRQTFFGIAFDHLVQQGY